MSPLEIKFALEAKRLALVPVPEITDIHSLVVEDSTCHIGFDVTPGDAPLFFAFEIPAAVSRGELSDFARWLTWWGFDVMRH